MNISYLYIWLFVSSFQIQHSCLFDLKCPFLPYLLHQFGSDITYTLCKMDTRNMLRFIGRGKWIFHIYIWLFVSYIIYVSNTICICSCIFIVIGEVNEYFISIYVYLFLPPQCSIAVYLTSRVHFCPSHYTSWGSDITYTLCVRWTQETKINDLWYFISYVSYSIENDYMTNIGDACTSYIYLIVC